MDVFIGLFISSKICNYSRGDVWCDASVYKIDGHYHGTKTTHIVVEPA